MTREQMGTILYIDFHDKFSLEVCVKAVELLCLDFGFSSPTIKRRS